MSLAAGSCDAQWGCTSFFQARLLFSLISVLGVASQTLAADVEETRKLLIKGDYAECIKVAGKAIDERAFGEDFYLFKSEAELNSGLYKEAYETISAGLTRYAWSVRLRQAGIEPARLSGNVMQGTLWQAEITDIVGRAAWRYNGDADSLVALGRVAAATGADARQVLEVFYDRALKVSPSHRGAILASGEMALSKKDFELAAETFEAGLKAHPQDPDIHFGLSRAIERSQPPLAAHHLSEALRLNPHHIPAILHRVDHAIDSEQYGDAAKLLDKALEVNKTSPLCWAYYAVLAHLNNDANSELDFRNRGLKPWPENPAVDYLIGRKLSQKYRFTEGAAHQRTALQFATNYQPARVQLAQDLLRLGEEDEGWKLSAAALKYDAYDVHVFNLVQLRDELDKFTTLEVDGFRVRMEAKEAEIYGSDVLLLLQRAKRTLCPKYGLELKDGITVEIFPDPNDFAVRTFGLPGAEGFLGVCFGKVITANSPASQKETPSNWQSVLWHEFCHVVTLEKTRNRMPRWLSEGISVYEERQASATWGQRMSPKHRKRILDRGVNPVREMSGSFLRPEKPEDLQFAYYQASLLVEYLVEKYGIESLKKVLDDLAVGILVEVAIERHTTSLNQLDMEFHDYAIEMARRLAPDLDWEQYDLSAIKDDDDPDRLERWVDDHPASIQGLTMLADQLISKREFVKAKKSLAKLIELYPEQTGLDSAYVLLSAIHRELNESDDERRVLEQYVSRTDDAKSALLRLIELQTRDKDWAAASISVKRLLEVNPLMPQAQKARAATSEQLGDRNDAIKGLRAWLLMDPDDPAEAHFRLAKLLDEGCLPGAKKHVLAALEAAPRYREAQKLLLKIVRSEPADAQQTLNNKPADDKRIRPAKVEF
jgi:tetratricopeptide (TPR) repeat protein